MARAVLAGQLTGLGFDLAWFSSLSSEHLYLRPSLCYMNLKFVVTFFTLFFGKLSLVGLALDLLTIVLQCCDTVGCLI